MATVKKTKISKVKYFSFFTVFIELSLYKIINLTFENVYY